MTYTVELSARAETDVKEAYNYIAKHGPANPDDWKAGLDLKFVSLERFPESCGFAPENDYAQEVLRQSIYGPYRIVFTIRNRTVYVITVRHGARRFLPSKDFDET